MSRMNVTLPGLKMKNPIMPASGCFGFGREYANLYDLNQLGAIVMKATTPEPRYGNPTPRVAETPAGMLNAIGLQNPGLEKVIHEELPWLSQFDVPIIANIAGSVIEDYVKVAKEISKVENVHALELNISCPNVKQEASPSERYRGGKRGHKRVKDARSTLCKVVTKCDRYYADGQGGRRWGADGISMINTITGLRLDIHTGRPIIANVTGGLSDRHQPIALRMIYEVSRR